MGRDGANLCVWLLVPILQAGALYNPGASAAENRQGQFALGVEYMVPGLARTYAETGVTWTKNQPEGFAWGEVEPNPPVGGKHTYYWTWTDKLILEYQRAGFKHFHIYTQCRSPWASSKPLPLIGHPSFPPKPEFLKDYALYLRNLVERYDGDGKDDAPGLLYPVEYYEIEAEWGTGFWQGTVKEYLDLLEVARRTVKAADPSAKIILQGFFLGGLFEGDPTPAELEERLRKKAPVYRKTLDEIAILLRHPDLFDAVEFHSLSDWTEILGTARFLRTEMRKNGCEKPIWVGDVNLTAPPLLCWGVVTPPYTADQKARIEETLRILKNPKHPRYNEVEGWFRMEQASGLVKKVVLAMGEGLAGINVGNLEDWDIFAWFPTITGTSAFQGLIDRAGIRPPEHGWPRVAGDRIPGAPRPAYYALALLSTKLSGFTEVARIRSTPGIYCYKFKLGTRTVVVEWYDDGRRYLPGDSTPVVSHMLALPGTTFRLTETPTRRGATGPDSHIVRADDGPGNLRVRVGAIPIFIEPAD